MPSDAIRSYLFTTRTSRVLELPRGSVRVGVGRWNVYLVPTIRKAATATPGVVGSFPRCNKAYVFTSLSEVIVRQVDP